MSKDQLLARLINEYKQAKDRLTLCETEAKQYSRAFERLSFGLSRGRMDINQREESLTVLPTSDQIRTLFADMLSARQETERLRAELLSLGIEVK